MPLRTVPSSIRTHTCAGAPWSTCTQNEASVPERMTIAGGNARAQCCRSSSEIAAAQSASVSARTPRAASTPTTVDSSTVTKFPTQS